MASPKNNPPKKGESLGVVVLQGFHGGDDRDRTDYLLNAIQALSQVSYAPMLHKNILFFNAIHLPLELGVVYCIVCAPK